MTCSTKCLQIAQLCLILVALFVWSCALLRGNEMPLQFPEMPLDWRQKMARLNDTLGHLLPRTPVDRVSNVTLCCHMMTIKANHLTKLPSVIDAWLHRCDHFFIVSDDEDARVPHLVVADNTTTGRQFLWDKSRFALRYARAEYGDTCDWFYKGDDDTFMMVERMKAFVGDYDRDVPFWSGYRYKKPFGTYMSGGSGYVMSNAALRLLVDKGLPDGKFCRQAGQSTEDVNVGKCMSALNVTTIDSRDSLGRHRFFPLSVPQMMSNESTWFKPWSLDYVTGKNCCSSEPIAFHYINTPTMKLLEFLVYRMKSLPAEDNFDDRSFFHEHHAIGNETL